MIMRLQSEATSMRGLNCFERIHTILCINELIRFVYPRTVMKTDMPTCLQLMLIALMLATAYCQLTLPVHHTAQQFQKRHSLTTQRKHSAIRHDMRNFKGLHQRSLTHDGVSLQSYNLTDMGFYFTLHLTIGGIPYNLNVDTGSSDLFIKGENSPGSPTVKYTCPSCLKSNHKYRIGYLDGSLNTYLAQLPVQLGNHTFNEYVLVAYTAAQNFQNAEGLVGLSFPQIAQNPNPTFIQTLIDNKIISSYAFGVNLNFQKHNRSFISFGQPDSSHYQGQLQNYSIGNSQSYSIDIEGLSVGSSRKFPIETGLLDTGTTCISIPERFADEILQQFNTDTKVNNCGFDLESFATQFSLLRCVVRNFTALPSFKVYIGKEVYEVDKDAYMESCETDGDVSLCDLMIESVKYESQLLMGDGFASRFYIYFDITNEQVGIAKNRENLSYKNVFRAYSNLDSEDVAFFGALK